MPFFSPTLEHRRFQTCLLRPLKVPSKYLKEDKVMPAAPTLSLKFLISKKKRLLSYMESDWPFVSFRWGWEAALLVKLRSTSDLIVNLNTKNELKSKAVFENNRFKKGSFLSDNCRIEKKKTYEKVNLELYEATQWNTEALKRTNCTWILQPEKN